MKKIYPPEQEVSLSHEILGIKVVTDSGNIMKYFVAQIAARTFKMFGFDNEHFSNECINRLNDNAFDTPRGCIDDIIYQRRQYRSLEAYKFVSNRELLQWLSHDG